MDPQGFRLVVNAEEAERVDYDGAKEKVAIVFRPAGIKTLACERWGQGREPSA
ncbi:MAG: hypothetical protein N2039_09950 [Gemmataceae bacterium]|nr:hypothetical protein [Gemmataceae bacterium]